MTLPRLMRILAVWVVLSIIVAAGFFFSFWPRPPHSALGWTLLLATALPLAALGEFLGHRVIFHSDIGAALNSLGHGVLPSVVRTLYVLIVLLALAAIASLIVSALNTTAWMSSL